MKNIRTSLTQTLHRLSYSEWLCLVLILYLLLVRCILIFSYNTDLEGVEFASIHFVQLLQLKHHLYSDPSVFPYLLVVYTPLYYYVMLGVVKLLSIDVVNNIHGLYIAGRVISFSLFFVSFYVLIRTIELIRINFKYRIYLLLFLLLFIPVHFFTFRPDSFKVTSFIIFLYYSVRFSQTNLYKHYLLSFLFLLAGILFKQDVLIYGVLLYGIFFLFFRKGIYLYSIFLLFAVLAGLIYFSYLWSGVNLYKELFLYNLQYDSDFHINLIAIAVYLLRIFPLLFLVYINLRSEDKMICAIALLSLVFVLASILFLFRMGSNFNYTYEAVILLAVNGAICAESRGIKKAASIFLVYSIINVFIVSKYFPLWVNRDNEKEYKTAYEHKRHVSEKVGQMIKNEIVFLPTMEHFIFFPGKNIIYGYDWHYDRYCELNLSIRLKPRFAVNDIVERYDANFNNGTVQFIVLEEGERAEEHIRKYYPHYYLYQQVEDFSIYKFK